MTNGSRWLPQTEDLDWRREYSLILILWGCFLARGFFYAGIIPIWEGYDEWAHFAYAQHLLAHGTLPSGTATRISREIEASLELLPLPWEMRNFSLPHATHDDYWRLTAEEQADRSRQLQSIPRDWALKSARSQTLLYEAQQMPLYYWLIAGPLYLVKDSPLLERVYFLRAIGLLIASSTVPIAYMVARRAFHHRGIAFGVAAVAVAMPEFVMELSRVTNDTLATALFSMLIFLAIKIHDEPSRTKWSTAYGLILGLGLLTKAYFLTAIPATVLVFQWLYWSKPAQRRRILMHGCLIAGMSLTIAGWWYIRSHTLTGSWSGLQQDVDLKYMSLPALLGQIPKIHWRVAMDALLVSHIYFGNWSFLQLRSWIYHLFRYLALIGGAGFLIFFWRCFRKNATWKWPGFDEAAILIPVSFYCTFSLGLAYDIMIIFASGGGSSTGGWYIYCLVIAEILLAVAGFMTLLPARLHSWILPLLVSCFAMLDLYATHFVLISYYTGLIAHKPNGALATLHIEQYANGGVGLAIHRLLENKPALWSESGLLMSWSLYLAATIVLVVLSGRLRPKSSIRAGAEIPSGDLSRST